MRKARWEKSDGLHGDAALGNPAGFTSGMGKLRQRAGRRVSSRVGGEKKRSVVLSMATARAGRGRAGRRIKGWGLAMLILSYRLNVCEAQWVSLCICVHSGPEGHPAAAWPPPSDLTAE